MDYAWLVQTLKDDPQVSGYVGTKIYPQVAAQGAAAPYITYNIVTTVPERCKTETTHDESRVQVSVFAQGYIELQNIYMAVRTALDRKKANGVRCDFINAVDLYENGDLLRHKAIDFKLITQN